MKIRVVLQRSWWLAGLLLLPACSRSSGLHFNPDALLFNAVLVPSGATVLPAEKERLSGALDSLSRFGSAWAGAGQQARTALLSANSPLRIQVASPDTFEIPGMRYLSSFGIGFGQDDLLRCASSSRAYQLIVTCRPQDVPVLYPAFQALSLGATAAMSGYIYDVNAKMVFTADAYAGTLYAPSTFDIRQHVLVQKYAYEPGRFRVVSLGMAKFGCPEVEVRDFAADSSLVIERLAYAVAARLAAARLGQASPPPFPKELVLEPSYIQGGFARPAAAAVTPAGPKAIRVGLERGKQDQGDPQENVVRLVPPGDFHGNMEQWSTELAGRLMGFAEKVDYLPTEAAPPAVVRKVQESLPAALEKFQAARGGGAVLFVKFACRLEGKGVEYLWMQVDNWIQPAIEGTLISEPYLAKNLSAGSRLKIRREDVVDWFTRDAAGKTEGNFTGTAGKLVNW